MEDDINDAEICGINKRVAIDLYGYLCLQNFTFNRGLAYGLYLHKNRIWRENNLLSERLTEHWTNLHATSELIFKFFSFASSIISSYLSPHV